jgi:NCS1 family nucleobase:cation symporter-1
MSNKTAMGLSVPQAMLVIVVSRILIALFSTIIAWAGLKWHIGFTVQNRYSWGMRGSFIPLLQRILLNFIWNAVQCKFSTFSFNWCKTIPYMSPSV